MNVAIRLAILAAAAVVAACTPADLVKSTSAAVAVADRGSVFVGERLAERREQKRRQRIKSAVAVLCTDMRPAELRQLPEVEQLGLESLCARFSLESN